MEKKSSPEKQGTLSSRIAANLVQPRLLGIEWKSFDATKSAHACLLFGCFFVAMFIHDAVQEQIQKRMAGMRFGLLFSMVECLACVVGPWLTDRTATVRRGPLKLYVLLSFFVCLSLSLANLSLGYVAYPIKVVGKSTKLVPAMLLSFCILNRSYSLHDYVCAMLLCLGLAGFTLAEYEATGEAVPMMGAVLLLGACLADAVSPNLQERLLTWRPEGGSSSAVPPSPVEVMFFTNLIGGSAIGVVAFATGELGTTAVFLYKDLHTFLLFVLMGTLTFIGITMYMTCVQQYSGVAVVLVATIRKCCTVVFSFLAFGHSSNLYHALSGVLLVSGIVVRTVGKERARQQKAQRAGTLGGNKVCLDPDLAQVPDGGASKA